MLGPQAHDEVEARPVLEVKIGQSLMHHGDLWYLQGLSTSQVESVCATDQATCLPDSRDLMEQGRCVQTGLVSVEAPRYS